jgi:hypothetical protein
LLDQDDFLVGAFMPVVSLATLAILALAWWC